MTDKQIIIDDLKEMIYKLQIECAEKTDNILALGEQLKSAEKVIEILEAKIGGHEYAISDIVKEYQGKLDSKEQECEELKSFHINLVGVKECEIKELLKLKQALTEIKEFCIDHTQLIHDAYPYLNIILEKINEVEDEHN